MKQGGILASLLGTSPLTSILGYIAAAITIAQPIITHDGFDFKRDWMTLLGAIAIGLLGRNSKDTNGVTAAQGYAMKEALIEEVPVEPKAATTLKVRTLQPPPIQEEVPVDDTEQVAQEPAKKKVASSIRPPRPSSPKPIKE